MGTIKDRNVMDLIEAKGEAGPGGQTERSGLSGPPSFIEDSLRAPGGV